jgi:uncharacterized protein (TIGR02300 family)
MMGRPELGTKYVCASCAERFYDLNRSPAICPKCGATQPPIIPRAARPVRTNFGGPYMSQRPSPVVAEEEAEPLAAVADDEDEDADDAADVPEIDADLDADVDPAIVRD